MQWTTSTTATGAHVSGDRAQQHLRRRLPSPLGELTLVADGHALIEVRLPGEPATASLAAGVSGATTRGRYDGGRAAQILPAAADQLDAYFAGRLRTFDLPLRLWGTPFQRQVWEALLDIAFGETTSYAALAAAIGRPGAARAVGHAVGQNPIAIVVPCHRVVGSDGSLTGYGGGLPAKELLLELEAGGGGAARLEARAWPGKETAPAGVVVE